MRPFLLVFGPALLVLSSLPLAGRGWSQAATTTVVPLTTAPAGARFAGESAVIEHLDSVTAMQADGTGYRELTMVLRVQSEAALREASVVTIPFASASERVEIQYARVRRADGTATETPVTEALEQPTEVTRQAPFYSDLKTKQLPVKSLRVGDVLEWKARVVRTKAEAPNQFWGEASVEESYVTLAESFELHVPKAMAVTVWSSPRLGFKPVETTTATERVYRWEHTNLKPTAGKEAEAAKELEKKTVLTPEQELDNEFGRYPPIAWTTFPTWEAVGAWYAKLEAGRTVPDADIKAKVAELTAGKTTQEDKVRAVYGFVGAQVRYIGVAFGIGRFQPHAAAEVLASQYGDCKDKHTLLAAMLQELGLHPDAVLIGEGVRFNPAVPSPAAFNHLITRVDVAGSPVWLDATAEVAPYRMLSYSLRDKQALVVPDGAAAFVARTPAALPFASLQKMTAVGTLDGSGTTESHIQIAVRGDSELVLRQVLRQVPPAQYPQLVARMVASMVFAGTSSHPDFSRAEDTAEPLVMSFDYHREKAGDWDHYRILPQLAPLELPLLDEKYPPVTAIQLGVPRTERSEAELKLPAGWGAELPEAVHAQNEFLQYDITYKLDKGTLYTARTLGVLKDRIPQAQWKVYKKWSDTVDLGSENYVQLTRPRAEGAAAKPAAGRMPLAAAPSNAEAAGLIRKAFEAMETRDLATAAPLLDQARELNVQQKNLWGAFGALAFDRGEMTEAARNYRKELALHPDSYWVYEPLWSSLQLTDHHADAVQALRDWAAADPNDPEPSRRLSAVLLEDGNAAAAVDAASAGVKNLPEERRNNPALNLALGKAQLKAGMDAQGAATLVAVLKDSDDAGTLNDAAYELADAKQELPLADASTRKALDLLTTEGAAWTLDEAPATLRRKSYLLAAAWDTMGWIDFREGKLEEAERYVTAAWHNGQHADVGEHLGDIEAAQGNQTEACLHYRLAMAALPAVDALGRKQSETPQAKRLKEKAERAKKAGGRSIDGDARKLLQAQRTLPLGPAAGRHGSAEYLVLVRGGKVVRSRPATEKTLVGAEDLIGKLSFAEFVPAEAKASLVRGALVNCHEDKCELILEP